MTKFLGKISQFELLVMTESNIFAYKLFLSLNILDFNLFFMWQLQPPPLKKVTSSFPATPLKKLRSCQAPPPLPPTPFVKVWLEAHPPPPPHPLQKGGGGAHYDWWDFINVEWHCITLYLNLLSFLNKK